MYIKGCKMIKNIIIGIIASLVGTAALAGPNQAHRHHGHGHGHGHWHSPHVHHWAVPALIGGATVYALTRPDPVVVQRPIIIQPTLQPGQVVIDGVVYTRQLMIINGVQQEVLVRQ
jgi:drug/metabolite transporter (DMT)-like permease